MNQIPPMTDPLGKYWEQPRDIREAPMDDKHVLLRDDQYRALHEYSSTMPSGVYPGKCWLRVERDRKTGKLTVFLGWYGEHPDPKLCSNNWREVLLA